MLAWMNAEALRLTRETGTVHFWSRSRQRAVEEGRDLGQHARASSSCGIDCDRDAVLGSRAARRSDLPHRCDELLLSADDDARRRWPRAPILHRLARRHRGAATPRPPRRATRGRCSTPGMPKILAKIAEEHGELAAELPAGDDAKVSTRPPICCSTSWSGSTARRIPIERVLAELARRFGTSGHVEKASGRESHGRPLDTASTLWPRSAGDRRRPARARRRPRARDPALRGPRRAAR